MTREHGLIPGHKFKRDKTVLRKHFMFHGHAKMCQCGEWSFNNIHDPENWAKKYVEGGAT